jgi:transposase
MPYLSGKIKIQGTTFDRRAKLNDNDKEFIKFLHETEQLSQRKLAFRFGVSRSLIRFVLMPEKLEQNLLRRAERGGSKKYYDKDKHKETMKNHRHYKEDLKVKGLIN